MLLFKCLIKKKKDWQCIYQALYYLLIYLLSHFPNSCKLALRKPLYINILIDQSPYYLKFKKIIKRIMKDQSMEYLTDKELNTDIN